MIQLRPYQQSFIDDTAKALSKGFTRVLGVAPTGSGKSVLIAGICDRASRRRPGTRILVLCSSSHILTQNEEKIQAMAPQLKTGIYCAGLGRKDRDADVVLASRDSLGRDPTACGQFTGILIDEAHQVEVDLEDSNTMYARIINAQTPRWVVGMTGTPWRLSGGRIWGKDKWFQTITSNIGMETLRKEGFLVPYIFPPMQTKIDTSKVIKASNGDFQIKQLDEVASAEQVIRDCVSEWWRNVGDRKVTLFFCVTRAHAQKTAKVIKEMCGIEVGYIDGEVTGNERKGFLDDIREGRYRAVCSVGVLTTGFDAPIIDCIVMMRPTLSASLFIQMAGRGLRPYRDKSDLLIIDMAGNFDRFGCLETPLVRQAQASGMTDDLPPTEGNAREVSMVPCPSCAAMVRENARFCKYCLEVLRATREETHTACKLRGVIKVLIDDYVTRAGEECKRVTYFFQTGRACEYFLVQRGGWAQRKFEMRERQLIGKSVRAVLCEIDGKLVKRVDSVEYHETQPCNVQVITKEDYERMNKQMSKSIFYPTSNRINF